MMANNNTTTSTTQQQQQQQPHDLRHVRAASIGTDCLMISWGRGDGWIVFYQKVVVVVVPQQQENYVGAKNNDTNSRKVGWNVVAAASPSRAVIHAATNKLSSDPHCAMMMMQEQEQEQEQPPEGQEGEQPPPQQQQQQQQEPPELTEQRLYNSNSLMVTDLIPMVMENVGGGVKSTATLAISRLGGFVELLPLPNYLWETHDHNYNNNTTTAASAAAEQGDNASVGTKSVGTTDTPVADHSTNVPPPRRRRRRRILPTPSPDGEIVNITASHVPTAFSTHQHSQDIIGMDVYRTNVDVDTEWDESQYPSGGGGPPSEFILGICGRTSSTSTPPAPLDGTSGEGVVPVILPHAKKETISFWGITVMHEMKDRDVNQNQKERFNTGDGDDSHSTGAENHAPLQFRLEVHRKGVFDLDNVGKDVGLFMEKKEDSSSGGVVDYWMMNHDEFDNEEKKEEEEEEEGSHRSKRLGCTITASAPIVSLRFTPNNDHRVLLAALDYNGGVSVIDCTRMVRSAEHNDVDNNVERAPVNTNESTPLVRLLCDREAMMSIASTTKSKNRSMRGKKKKKMMMACALQIEWWSVGKQSAGKEEDQDGGDISDTCTLASYSTTAQIQRRKKPASKAIIRLQQWSSLSSGEENVTSDHPTNAFCMSISSKSSTTSTIALLPMMPHHQSSHYETLSFLQLSPPTSTTSLSNHLCVSLQGIRKYTEPSSIISTLLQRGNPQQALQVARRFGGAQQFGGKVMNTCRKQLWEDQCDVKALLQLVGDDLYVVGEAVKLTNIDANILLEGVTLDDLLAIFKEGLSRCIILRERANGDDDTDPHWIASNIALLASTIHRLGTFQLLLSHFACVHDCEQPSDDVMTHRFLHEFQHVSLNDFLSCVASKGDIDALTIMLARHPMSVGERMKLLNCIPLDADVGEYERLLPSIHIESKNGRKADGFLLRNISPTDCDKTLSFFSSRDLFSYQCERQQAKEKSPLTVDVFTNDADRENAMIYLNASASISNHEVVLNLEETVATWYLRRAIDIQNQTGHILSTKQVCEVGLIRLGCMQVTDGPGTDSEAVKKLTYLYSAASLFENILANKVKGPLQSSQVLSMESFPGLKNLFMSVILFCSMNLADTIPFVIEGSDTRSSISTFQKHVAHFVDGGECIEPAETGAIVPGNSNAEELANRLERDMMEQCMNEVRHLQNDISLDKHTLALRLEDSLSVCVAFASTGIRDLQNENGLVEFAEEAYYCTINTVKGDWALITEGVIDKLWSVFELLPFSASLDQEDPSPFHQRKSSLKFRLVVLQLCCKWRGQQTVPHGLWNFMSLRGGPGNGFSKDICMAADSVLSIMCSSLCQMTRRLGSNERDFPSQEDLDLLFNFVSDVDEFDRRFLSSGVQESGYLAKFLLSPLLSQQSFGMLKSILKIRPGWFSQDFVQSVILSFIRDDMASNDNNGNIAVLCQDVLGPIFPDLHAKFELQQRMIDARQFVSEAMKMEQHASEEIFSVDYSGNPISLVRALVETNPQAVLLGCDFWSDKESASNACFDASIYFSSQISVSLNKGTAEETNHVLPPMPGALVMQFANIVGVHTAHDILTVKRFMVDGALDLGLGPAAAAICYSMLCDAAFSRKQSAASGAEWTSQHDLQMLDCVVAIVRHKGFSNIHMKKEMCLLALRLCSNGEWSPNSTMLEAFKTLEYQLLYLEIDSDASAGPVVGGNTFYDQSMNHICSDMKQSTETDLLQLLSSTGGIMSSSDESKLIAISEAVFKWIVTEVLITRTSSPSSLSAANLPMLMELAFSCLSELRDLETAKLVMKQVLGEFGAKSSLSQNDESSSLDISIQPDMELVQRLNDRGYGWNAARRAVITTQNQGYSAALTWAVTHFQDADFDAPIYFLHTESSAGANQHLIELTRKFLHSIEQQLETNMKPKASEGPTKHSTGKPTSIATRKQTDIKSCRAKGSSISVKTQSSTSSKTKRVSRIPSPITTQRTRVPLKAEVKQAAQNENKGFSRTAAGGSARQSKLPSPSTLPMSPLSTTTPTNGSRSIPTRPPYSGGSVSSVEGSLSSHASIKRQVQIGKSKLGTQKLTLEERKRLAMEGKRLLNAARTKQKSVIAPPTSITTSRRP